MPKNLSLQRAKTKEAATGAHLLSRRSVLLLLVVLLLASFVLRAYRLGDKSIWWDEGLAAWAARQSLGDIARWTAADVHPPLYFWILHFWRLGSGDSEFGLRLFSAMIGVLTVAATYLLGQRAGGQKVGLLAALLVSLSRFDVWWSQEARMYILAALWAPLALWAAIRFWDRRRTLDGALYVLFIVAGLYTLYLSVSVMVVANLAWLWVFWHAKDRRRALLRWGAAQVAVLLLYAPWLIYALGRIPTWSSASPVAVDVFLRIFWTVLTTGIPVSVENYRWLTLPALLVFVLGLLALFWKGRRDWQRARNVVLFLLGLLLPAAVVYLVSLPKETFFYSPQLAPRYLLIFAPAFYVLLGWGIVSLSENRSWLVAAALAAVVLAAAGYGLWQYYPGRILLDDYKSLEATLRAYQRPSDAVVLYTDKDWPVFAYHHSGRWWGIPHAQSMTPQAAAAYLAPLWRDHDGVWLVVTPYAPVNDPAGEIPAWLAARSRGTVEHRFADKALRFYARTEARADTVQQLTPGFSPPHPLEMRLGSHLWLAGYGLPVQEVQSGDPVHLFLYLKPEPSNGLPPAELSVSLVGDGDRSWKQVRVPGPDLSPEGGLVRQQVDLVLPPDVPDGTYTFAVQAGSDGAVVRFGRISVRHRQRATLTAADVTIAHRLQTDFADGVRLLGYDLEKARVAPGENVFLTLYWQAREPVEHRYKVFTHLLGGVFNAESNNFLWGQQDNEPVSGSRLTTTWQVDEVIVDSYAISVHPQAPPGPYTIEIGLYDPATGLRLPVLDEQGRVAADHLLLTQVSVETP
jgi:4-amino-4-deoxy-L-arabinose transferase-like glycosyltransferase